MFKAQQCLFCGKLIAKFVEGDKGTGQATISTRDNVWLIQMSICALFLFENNHLSPRKISKLLDMDLGDGSDLN